MIKSSDLLNKYFGFYDGEDSRNNVVSLLRNNTAKNPDKIMLMWADPLTRSRLGDEISESILHLGITFKQFYELTMRTASGLLKAGVGRGDCVILFLPMSFELYQAMSAVMAIGARAVFLDSWARREHLGVSAKVVNPKAMISFEQAFEFCEGVPELSEIPVKIVVGPHKRSYSASLEKLQQSQMLDEICAVEGEETALITFTTGSSGTPKGANRTHRFLVSQHLALDSSIPYKVSDVDLPAFPIFSLNNIAAGVQTVIPVTDIGRPGDKDPVMLVSQIISCSITCATLSPSMVEGIGRFCEENMITMPKVRRVVTGGAPISNDTLARFKKCVPNAKVWVLYGSTEVEPIAHIEASDILFPGSQGVSKGEGVNVGKIAEGLQYKLIKIVKAPVSIDNKGWSDLTAANGEVGELIVSGLHVCRSYYKNEEADRKTKIIEPDGTVWHRTGDLAYFDQEENLWLVGRVHNAILRNGELLFPVKAEFLMKKNPDVKQAAYIGIPDEKLGEKAYALISLTDNPKSSCEEILKEVSCALKNENVVFDYLGIVESIPMDPRHHSKVEYEVLRQQILKTDDIKL
ncbi:MAG: AMP-binding protein [Bacillota bacterium]